ncbi:MAG: hypothetical protein ACLR76_02655 [Alistipes sp.]
MTAEETALPASLIDADTQRRLIRAVHGCPNGVMRMSPDETVQTSTNHSRRLVRRPDRGTMPVA